METAYFIYKALKKNAAPCILLITKFKIGLFWNKSILYQHSSEPDETAKKFKN